MSDPLDNSLEAIKEQQESLKKLQDAAGTLLDIGALTPGEAQAISDLFQTSESLLKTVEKLKQSQK